MATVHGVDVHSRIPEARPRPRGLRVTMRRDYPWGEIALNQALVTDGDTVTVHHTIDGFDANGNPVKLVKVFHFKFEESQ